MDEITHERKKTSLRNLKFEVRRKVHEHSWMNVSGCVFNSSLDYRVGIKSFLASLNS